MSRTLIHIHLSYACSPKQRCQKGAPIPHHLQCLSEIRTVFDKDVPCEISKVNFASMGSHTKALQKKKKKKKEHGFPSKLGVFTYTFNEGFACGISSTLISKSEQLLSEAKNRQLAYIYFCTKTRRDKVS